MQGQVLARKLKKLPDSPGVYFFLGSRKKILYIGRATSLRSRVRSYFAPDIAEKRSSWIAQMLPLVRSVDFRKADSVLEAILLEADLIKKLKPPYNTDLKDDKSFNCVVITDEKFPRVLLVRQKETLRADDTRSFPPSTSGVREAQSVFGPFPHGTHLKVALKIIRKIFPFRDTCIPFTTHERHPHKLENVRVSRACFNRQIGLCPGVCTGEVSAKEYRKHIKRLALFLSGKKARIQKELEREMKAAARRQEFEKAGELKRQLFALRHIQDIALLKRNAADSRRFENADARRYRSPSASISGHISEHQRFRIEAYDISHFGGRGIVGAMAVVENGAARRSEYRLFKLRSIKGPHETTGLQEILRRRLNHAEWTLPQLIVVDGNEVQKKAAEAVLAKLGHRIPIVAVVKDERHRPRGIIGVEVRLKLGRLSRTSTNILLANSEAHRFALRFQRKGRML